MLVIKEETLKNHEKYLEASITWFDFPNFRNMIFDLFSVQEVLKKLTEKYSNKRSKDENMFWLVALVEYKQ